MKDTRDLRNWKRKVLKYMQSTVTRISYSEDNCNLSILWLAWFRYFWGLKEVHCTKIVKKLAVDSRLSI